MAQQQNQERMNREQQNQRQNPRQGSGQNFGQGPSQGQSRSTGSSGPQGSSSGSGDRSRSFGKGERNRQDFSDRDYAVMGRREDRQEEEENDRGDFATTSRNQSKGMGSRETEEDEAESVTKRDQRRSA